MSTLDQAKQQIIAALAPHLGEVTPFASDLVRPPQKELGDLAYPCFAAAKALKKSPVAVAKDLASAVKLSGLIASAEAAGPYVNFRFNRAAFATAVMDDIISMPATYGNGTPGKETVMIEYASPNTHKELHIGHLRNLVLGLSVVKLAEVHGHTVIPVSYMGDIGAHVAKCLWAYQKFHAGASMPENRGAFLGRIYSEATREVEEHPDYKDEVAEVQRKLEARDPEWTALWERTREWSLEEFAAVFKELGISFKHSYYESEVEESGKQLVRELLAKGIAQEGERGALIVDLEKEKLGIFLVLKSDGSSLYSTKELALAQKKFADFPGVAESIHIVDTRQALYFKQLFATLGRMGFDKRMMHLGYEFVTLKEGAMSSRKGNIVTYEDFRDEMVRRAAEETRKRRTEWSESKINEIAWLVAEAALKFGMLKQDIERPIVFDVDEALSFDGFTGPYLQYAHARLASILHKAGNTKSAPANGSDDPAEFAVLSLAAELPQIISAAASAYKPSLLAQYLFDLAQAANAFYRDVPVLDAPAEDRERRLAIVAAVKIALGRGLSLLGIRAPEEM